MDEHPSMIGREQVGERGAVCRRCAGFSLIDLLVSIVVMGVLIAVLMPAVAHVRDMARRTECRSNIRQQGLALQMYAYDYGGRLPRTVFSMEIQEFGFAPQETVHLRVDASHSKYDGHMERAADWSVWDGLGLLFHKDYIAVPQVFYCPSNDGLHSYQQFAARFSHEPGPIVGNYQYRIVSGRSYLSDLDPTFTVVSNATRSPAEYSHRVGNNMLKADMSVSWYSDVAGRLMSALSYSAIAGREGEHDGVEIAWKLMDTGGRYVDRLHGGGPRLQDGPDSNADESRDQYKKETGG